MNLLVWRSEEGKSSDLLILDDSSRLQGPPSDVNCRAQVSSRSLENAPDGSGAGLAGWRMETGLPLQEIRSSGAEASLDSSDSEEVEMWIHQDTDEKLIKVKEWCHKGAAGKSKGKTWQLWWARVTAVDRSQYTCNECKGTASEHGPRCGYHGQTLCAWCNMYPCKHGKVCTRKNFGCNYCHYSITGHCIGNDSDVRRYKLNNHVKSSK